MNLYLKYRPQTIDELDLSKVREAINVFVKANQLSHAYLFTGPRGAGKTSAARIIARVVNCEKNKDKLGEPCNECSACRSIIDGSALDVIEIDAASNRGIDDIRELKEKIRLAPIILPYKVYIIDEVYMLTTEAFNALLKTLEEPPKHSLFVLCTTELHKVPETIVSRCVQVNFYKATKEELARSLGRVLRGEGASLSDEILQFIGERVDGSFRDGVKILEQVLTYGSEVTSEQVESLLAASSSVQVESWVRAMIDKDAERSLMIVNDVVNRGGDLVAFLVAAMQSLRLALLTSYGLGDSKLAVESSLGVELVRRIDNVAKSISSSALPQLVVEVMVIEWAGRQSGQKSGGQGEKNADKPVVKQVEVKPKEERAAEAYQDQLMDGAQLRSLWRQMLGRIDKAQYSLEALLSKASPSRVEGKNLIVRVGYDFHKTQLETSKYRSAVEQLVSEVYGMPLIIVYEVIKDDTMISVEPVDDLVQQAQEIFVN